MENNQNIFRYLKVKDMPNASQPLNLGCVEVIIKPDHIIIGADPEFTGIHRAIHYDRKGEFKLIKDYKFGSQAKGAIRFSLFMGAIEVVGVTFFLFVHEVKVIQIEQHFVFEIQSVMAYDNENFVPDLLISENFTSLFHQSVYFSYSLDLTNGDDYFDICDVKQRRTSPNFFFMTNLNAIRSFLEFQTGEWMVPLCSGKLMKMNISHSTFYIIYKESLLDQSTKLKEDINLLSNFYCPSSMRTLDIILVQQGQVKFVNRVILNNFPGIVVKPEKRPNVYEGLNYNPNRIYRYYQFFNEYFQCSNFLIHGSEEMCFLMNKLSRFFEHKMETTETINTNQIVTLNLKDDLFEALEKFVAQNCIHMQGKFANCPSFFCFSVCSEIQLSGLKQIGLLIFDYFFSASTAPIVDGYCWDLIGQNKSDQEQFKEQLEEFFHKIAIREESMELIRQKPLKKTKLSVFGQFSALIDEFYGPRKLISKFFEQVIRARSLNVFSEHETKICLITHNCGGQIPKELSQVGYASNPEILQSDLVILSLQEIIEMKYRNFKSIFWKHDEQAESSWIKFMPVLFPDFICVGNVSLAGLMIITLVNKKCKAFLEISLEKQKTDHMGFMNLLPNKGYIFLDLKINYERMKISNNHFEAGNSEKEHKVRVDQINKVVEVYEMKRYSNVGFICGDLNFRLNIDSLAAQELLISCKKQPEMQQSIIDQLLKHDRFSKMLAPDGQLKNVYEFPIKFLPTYKKKMGSNEYNSDKQIPAWLTKQD